MNNLPCMDPLPEGAHAYSDSLPTEAPLSKGQIELWMMDSILDDKSINNLINISLIDINIKFSHIRKIIKALLQDHPSWRTHFFIRDGRPFQKIRHKFSTNLTSINCKNWSYVDFRQWLAMESKVSFDLSNSAFRSYYLTNCPYSKNAAPGNVLIIMVHHIVADFASVSLLTAELNRLHLTSSGKAPGNISKKLPRYVDFTHLEPDFFQEPALETLKSYWTECLKDYSPAPALPLDPPRHLDAALPSVRWSFALPKPLSEALRTLGRTHSATPYLTVLSAYFIFLHRYTSSSDVIVGTPVSTRPKAFKDVIGYFVNLLPVRATLEGHHTFGEVVLQVRSSLDGAMKHKHLPYGEIARLCNVQAPLFQTAFAWERIKTLARPGQEDSLPPLVIENIDSYQLGSHHPLMISVYDDTENLSMLWHYNPSLFQESAIQRMATSFTRLLEGLLSSPDKPITHFPILGEAEYQRITQHFNGSEAPFPRKAIHTLFEEQALANPASPALFHGSHCLTYGELNQKANSLAHWLRTQGAGPTRPVAICMDRGLDLVVGLLAILKTGAAYVPMDPAFPAERLQYILEESNPVALLTDQNRCQQLGIVPGTLTVISFGDGIPEPAPNLEPLPFVNPHTLAYVIFTSGSTGKPKGVMVEHLGVVNLLTSLSTHIAFSPKERVLALTTVSFDISVLEIFLPLIAGASICIADKKEAANPVWIGQKVDEGEITVLQATPATWRMLLDSGWRGHKSLKALCGGEAMTGELAARLSRRVGHLWNVYGPTETTIWSTIAKIASAPPGCCQSHVPIGVPVANTQIYILDPTGQPVPVGVAGEIHIGGVGVARGYLNNPRLTEERFLPDPFSAQPGARIYKTGDLGRWQTNGTIECLGRNDSQVKIRGFRIELGEIEARLLKHPNIRDAAVVVREDTPGDKRLVAYFTGLEPSVESLRQHLSSCLPDYMVPAAYVRLEALPLTPNNKVDRKRLPAPDELAFARKPFEAPCGEYEILLAAFWSECLGIEKIGRYDNFFELGGHSLQVIQIISRLKEALDIDIPIGEAFNKPVIAEFAALLSVSNPKPIAPTVPPNLIPASCSAITPDMLSLVKLSRSEIQAIEAATPGGAANIQAIYPLAPLQEGILFHYLASTGPDAYLLPFLMAFRTEETLQTFIHGFQAVVNRHDILRTAFLWEGLPEPLQVVWREAPLTIEKITLDPALDGEDQLRRHIQERHCRLDLQKAPITHLCFGQDAQNHRWLSAILFHHLLGDNSSMTVIREEIRVHMQGRTEDLGTPIPYRNLVAQARLGLSKDEHEAFFRRMLHDIDEPTAPYGILDVQGNGSNLVECHCEVNKALASQIRQQARRLGVSAASLFHHAWAQVLGRLTGRRDVVFGTSLFGRMQGNTGGNRGIGLFLNSLPFRVTLDEVGIAESVKKTHMKLAELMRHEHASLALAQRCSAVQAPLPLFTAHLNYRHNATSGHPSFLEGVESLSLQEGSNYPVNLDVDDTGEGFILTTQILECLNPKRLCGYMHQSLAALTEALDATPCLPAWDLDILPEGERTQLLKTWNATERAFPFKNRLAHEIFEAQAEHYPEKTAALDGPRAITYRELNAKANRLAHYLRGQGVEPDTKVAICVNKSLEMLVAMLGVLKAGGAYLPMDPAHPTDRLRRIIGEASPAAILVQGQMEWCRGEGIHVPLINLNQAFESYPDTNPDPALLGLNSEHLAYVCYTSGSTGLPKGVMIEHRSLWNLCQANQRVFKIHPHDRVLQFIPYYFDGSLEEIFGAFHAGATLVLRTDEWPLDTSGFWDQVRHHRISIVDLPTRYWQTLAHDTAQTVPECLQKIIIYGEAVEQAALKAWFNRRDHRPRLFNTYGPTETTVNATIRELTPDPSGWDSLGGPLDNVRAYVLDERHRLCPIDVPGELYIGGIGVARGYLNQPALTAERFITTLDQRLYKTGDLVCWLSDGTLQFLGRNDHQVKIRGYRIELGEIESRLLEFNHIRQTVVTVQEHQKGDKKLVAYLATSLENPPDLDALRSHLRGRLPEYMIPSVFVTLETLPLTPNGKVDRAALPIPQVNVSDQEGHVPPESPIEVKIAGMWSDLLKVERVSRFDNFFELGGHSLLTIQLIEKMRREGIHLDVRAVFTARTLADLAFATHSGIKPKEIPVNLVEPPGSASGDHICLEI